MILLGRSSPDCPEYNCIGACVAQSVEQFIRNERVVGCR